MPVLIARQVTMRFGGLTAVNELNMTLNAGDLYGLIGPNGAGKTTIFNLLTGVYTPTEGEIIFEGRSIVGKKSWKIAELGIARTFQNIRLFADLSVLDNVRVAFARRQKASLLSTLAVGPRFRSEERRIEKEALALLEIFKLRDLAEDRAGSLPYGSQRRLEIARAMATKPKLLCLDEPAAGMNPAESRELMNLIRWVRDRFRMTILLVEHNMTVVMGVCERVQVLDYGSTICIGTPEEVRHDTRTIHAYLGSG